MIIKIVDFCEKLEKVEACGEISSYFLTFSMEKISLGVEEENFSTKNNKGWRTSTHKNEHEMESISPHASTYFPTSHTNQVFLFSFYMLLSNGA